MAVQFRPSAELRVFDQTTYDQIKADYGVSDVGTNPGNQWALIDGISPQSLMTRYGLHQATGFSDIPAMLFTNPSSYVLSTVVPIDVTGPQVLTGQDYTDPNGQHFTSVTWEWRIVVERFTPSLFSQQVVTWVGDGTANRLIPTTANLTVGVTGIIIFSDGGAPVMATSAMITAGKFATYAVDPASTTAGVVSLATTGFRVTGGVGVSVNANPFTYTAIVWNDTLGTKMACGTYTGGWDGSALHALPQTVLSGLGSSLNVGFITGGAQATVPDCVYFDAERNVGLNISTAEAFPLTGVIVSASNGMFTVGQSGSLNTLGHTYFFLVFAIASDDALRTTMFQTWTKLGTAGTDVVSALTFTPGFALARTYEYPTFGAAWRGPLDVGTASHTTISGGATATGITALGAGTLDLGSSVSPNGITAYGFALAGSPAAASVAPAPTWTSTESLDLGNGTISTIQTSQQSQTSPGSDWHFQGPSPTYSWWCYPSLGLSVYQIDSPGAGWVACSGPATSNGWYLSTAEFGNQDTIVSGGRPADPRTWANLATWCTTGNMSVYGGSPGAACSINNQFVYPAAGYTVGTHYPPIRVFDGRQDRELCRLPPTTANVVPKAVISMLAANGTVYLTTWDSGTTSADWAGRVFELNPTTGILTVLGTVFAAGEMPYALAWHMGRLWCGTNNSIGTVGKVYFFRPGIDTAWTQDYATSSSTAGGVTAMASYGGKLYVGTDNAAASRGKVLVRDTAGAYTTSQTGTGGTARVNNGYLALTVLGANLYASYWNNDSSVAVISKIEKYTGSAWSTAYTGADLTLVPFIALQLDNAEIYAVGGSLAYDAALLVTADGTTWTNLTPLLPVETATLLPMFGAVVT